MKIDSHDTDIESLFTSNFLVIPRFQRPYSWDDENLEDFWNDVVQAGGNDYFIGSMVLYKSGRQEFGVVDGQQRLTTITILLCVIRNVLAELGSNKLADGIHALIERGDRDSVNRFVVMTETSYPFFAEEIQKYDDKDFSTQPLREEKRLQASYNFFEKKIHGILKAIDSDTAIMVDDKLPIKIKRLVTLRDSVLFLSLIRIELGNEDDAYLIFETLNTRGKDLALTDLLKNHFLKSIKGKGSVDSAKILWTKILTNIETKKSSAEAKEPEYPVRTWNQPIQNKAPPPDPILTNPRLGPKQLPTLTVWMTNGKLETPWQQQRTLSVKQQEPWQKAEATSQSPRFSSWTLIVQRHP